MATYDHLAPSTFQPGESNARAVREEEPPVEGVLRPGEPGRPHPEPPIVEPPLFRPDHGLPRQ